MRGDLREILLTEEQIKKKVEELGEQIRKDYEGKDLLMVSILKGSVIFMADLMRAIKAPLAIDFMAVSSYGDGSSSTGAVKIVLDLDVSVEGRDLLIVEDILDSGNTLHYVKNILKDRKPRSIKVCTFLDKPERRQKEFELDYCGFVIPDEFVVGYGLDYAQRYRNFPFIGVLKPEIYSKD